MQIRAKDKDDIDVDEEGWVVGFWGWLDAVTEDMMPCDTDTDTVELAWFVSGLSIQSAMKRFKSYSDPFLELPHTSLVPS